MEVKLLSNMTTEEKIAIVKGLIEQFTKSNEREPSLKRELADDQLMVKKISEMIAAGEPLPLDCPYTSLEEWFESAQKEVSTSVKSLAKIEEQKVEIEALQYYVDNVTVTP